MTIAVDWDVKNQTKPKNNPHVTLAEKQFSCFSTKPYVVGSQKNHLNEMVLLNTKNIYAKNYG